MIKSQAAPSRGLNFLQYAPSSLQKNGAMKTVSFKNHMRSSGRRTWVLGVLGVLSLAIVWAFEPLQYPDGFRRWVHVGTGVILPGGSIPANEQGMHHVFANEKAVEGYASG